MKIDLHGKTHPEGLELIEEYSDEDFKKTKYQN